MSPSTSSSSTEPLAMDTKPMTAPISQNPQLPHRAPLTPRKSSSDLTSTTTTPCPATKIPTSHLPPTPETTPHFSSRTLKRPLPTDVEDSPSKNRQQKRHTSSLDTETSTTIIASPEAGKYLFLPASTSTSTSTSNTPTSRPLFKKPSFNNNKKIRPLAAVELKRASEAILLQIDWLDVAAYVACNRKGVVYKNAVKDVLQRAVDGLFEEERRRGEDEE